MPNKIDLSGRFAVVTGGGRGIGRAIVERFLNSGAAVAICDCDKALAEQTGLGLYRSRMAACYKFGAVIHSLPGRRSYSATAERNDALGGPACE